MAERQRRLATARGLFLKASACYASAYHPLYRVPVDPRLPAAFHKQIAAFDAGLAIGEHPPEHVQIPFENATLPGYLVRAAGHERETRPLLILTNGYDATVTEMYFASAVAAAQRGYHCLLFDGPGQGAPLIEQGLHLRPDWEVVVRAVVDVALGLPNIDPKRIALSSWSLGGYLACRAASGEPRLAACIADPGLWGIAAGFGDFLTQLGAPPNAADDIGNLDQAVVDRLAQTAEQNPRRHWTIMQRGFWVHGVDSVRGFLQAIVPFTLDGRVDAIACPTLLTRAENDPLGGTAQRIFDALRCPKTLLEFTAAEGAGDHCELFNRTLLNARVFDWLDSVFVPD